MRLFRLLALGACGFLAASQAAVATPIADRSQLESILGGPGTLETFSTYVPPAGSFDYLDCSTLNSTSVCNGQGPGLVATGLSITGQPAWIDTGYLGLPSRMLGDATGSDDLFAFTTPVTAFGADLYAFAGFPSLDAMLYIFGPDETTLIGQISGISLTTAGTFVGWSDLAGIGGFAMSYGSGLSTFIPNIDNLEFGSGTSSVPEPGTSALLGIGIAALAGIRRRKFAR